MLVVCYSFFIEVYYPLYNVLTLLNYHVQKKRKLASSLLLLGTGGGDVLALDVSAGQLKWKVNNCHPG